MTIKILYQEADLELLTEGDRIKARLLGSTSHQMVYEGKIDGKVAFLTRNNKGLSSWRIEPKFTTFGNGELILHSIHATLENYTKNMSTYSEKEQLLANAGL